ncbi:DUF6090 family protein [Flagellimonas meridianipacifica]|uniref:Uncharacterized protein n=1 Tax=Flagellimonas meridianipacifica TaxID=1080225 RepID=A0A2T0MFF3_9FLAO|nr:DUF6090 family protein [Allomuricauda pacifica]PRX56303.1 hypothetical protein CLV81_0298 [Allomuricauda pacifica]
MAKIFRKFRKRLMSENKFSKYALYAVGEIVLVVIGILIAVRINDYNTFNKERKEEFRLLNKFKEDFKQDSIDLSGLIEKETRVLNNIDSIFRILETENDQHLPQLASISQTIANSHIFYTQSGTYDESISAGKMDVILNDSLRETIFGYYGEVKINLSDAVFDKYQTNEIVPAYMEIMLQNKQAAGLMGLNNPYLEDLSVSRLYQNKKFNEILIWRKINAGYAVGTWMEYQELCSSILSLVKEEIQNHPQN